MNINIKVECGFLNGKVPLFYHKKPLFVCLLVERSDGYLIEFKRIRYKAFIPSPSQLIIYSARLLSNSQDILISTEIVHHTQYITCYVMCDEIGNSSSVFTLLDGS